MSELDTESVGFKIVGYSIVGVGITILFGALIVLGYFVSGLVLSIMWEWFIVSTFPLAPPITILEAIGITLIMGLFTSKLATVASVDDEERLSYRLAKSLGRFLIQPFIALFIAWIVYKLM